MAQLQHTQGAAAALRIVAAQVVLAVLEAGERAELAVGLRAAQEL
jgi:hypothetical protein